ncbi:MAG: chemotaxis protein CheB [Cyanobacteria bacterium J06621_11]
MKQAYNRENKSHSQNFQDTMALSDHSTRPSENAQPKVEAPPKKNVSSQAESSLGFDTAGSATNTFPVVGIGASAGGLRALEDFFDNLPYDGGAAYVVVQHLSPNFKSLMKELLAQRTKMTIRRVTDGMKIEPDTIFLIPPGQNLILVSGELRLTAQNRDSRRQPHFPIDLFFQSLAKECQEKAVGIVLSGTGSDGTRGIQSIAEMGGIVMVQSPDAAEFDGMPLSAIATSLADLILPSNELAKATHQLVTSPTQRAELHQPATTSKTQIQRVIAIIERYEHIDFTHYKPTTIKRRINRRCLIAGYSTLETYIQHLEDSPDERAHLRNDMLITVTQFFRDPSAWHHLKTQILPKIIQRAQAGSKSIRIWVTACATGEEAYSIAILLKELLGNNPDGIETKIFATDIDPIALAKASSGIFPEATLRNLSHEQIERFFTPKDGKFEVSKGLREMIIFANHNLTKDAGFTQIDLTSCRNVLIYLQPDLQQQVLRSLHFSLKKDSYLFLGESENLGDIQTEFKTEQQTWKIYRKLRDIRLPLISNHLLQAKANQSRLQANLPSPKPKFDPLLADAFKALLQGRQATCFLVDRDNSLLHLCGDTLQLMRLSDGKASQDVLRLVPSALQLPLNTALHRARNQETVVRYSRCAIDDSDYTVNSVSIEVSQQRSAQAGLFLMVLIEAEKAIVPSAFVKQECTAADEDTAQYVEQLQQELQTNRENLQATIEELETTNEEQQATNEELIASNEELQSTNEELHSVNEELYTVNAEYQSKIVELTQLNNDLDNLLNNLKTGVIYLDVHLQIRKFTPSVTQAFNLVSADIGRPLEHLSHNLENVDIGEMLTQALGATGNIEHEVRLKKDGPHMLMQIAQYKNENNVVDGLVMTLVNVHEIKQAQQQLAEATEQLHQANEQLEAEVRARTAELNSSQQLLQSITESTPNGIYVYDLEEKRNVYANTFLERMLGYTQDELLALGDGLNEYIYHTDDLPRIAAHHQMIRASSVADNHIFELEYQARNSEGGWRTLYSQDTVFSRDLKGRPLQILGAVIDISDRKADSIRIQQSEARYRHLYHNAPVMMYSIDLAGNILSVSNSWLKRFGYREQDVIGQPITNFLTASYDSSQGSVECPPWLSDKGCKQFNCQFTSKEGDTVDVELSAVVEKNEVDQSHQLLTVLIDTTERNKAETELIRYREHLEDLVANRAAEIQATNEKLTKEVTERIDAQRALDERAQSLERSNADLEQFAYVISHDLQEPLRAMTVFSQLLKQRYYTDLDETAGGYIRHIVEGGIRMQALIDGILDFSRVTHRSQVLKEISIDTIVNTVLSSLSTLLSESNVKVTVDPLPKLACDANQITQLFQNLISNAIKFKGGTAPTIHISAVPQPSEEHIQHWMFGVADNGIGIETSNDQQARIFSLFQRLHTRQELEGYGIGLAICKKIVERHKGRIWVESSPGKGSTFYFTLAAQANPEANTSADQKAMKSVKS